MKATADKLYQWDLGQMVEIVLDKGESIDEVNFRNPCGTEAFVMELEPTDTGFKVNIPNILLQKTHDIRMWVMKSDQTKEEFSFPVQKRQRPADYVYTETEVLSYKKLEERIVALEESGAGVSEEVVVEIVEEYMAEHPIQSGATAEQVEQINKNTTDIGNLSKEIDDLKQNGTGIGTVGVNNLKGKKWVAFGDSITGQIYNYAQIIANSKGVELTRSARGGMSVSWIVKNKCMLDWFTTQTYGSFTYEDGYKPDFVTIMVGVNDYVGAPIGTLADDNKTQSETNYSFIGCYCNLIRAIYNKWGYVPIYLITPPSIRHGYGAGGAGATLEEYAEAVIDIANYFNLPVYDLYHTTHMMHGLTADYFTADGTHPSAKAFEMWSHRLFEFLNEHEGTMSLETYSVTNNLTNVANSSSIETVVIKDTSYNAVLVPTGGYNVDSVTVTMGGVDVTSEVYNGDNGKINIDCVTGDLVITAVASVDTSYFTITNNLTNVTNSNMETAVENGSSYSGTLTTGYGYVMGTVTVTMGGVDITAGAYNSSTGAINIATVTGNVVITATANYTAYSVTNNLTNVRNSNAVSSVTIGGSYEGTLAVSDGYTMSSVVITMGETDITSSAYNSETGVINISSVSGNIIITAVAEENVATAVYSLENKIFDGTNGVATDWTLDYEKDWTICLSLKDIVAPTDAIKYAVYYSSQWMWQVKTTGAITFILPNSTVFSKIATEQKIVIVNDGATKTWTRYMYQGTAITDASASDEHDYASANSDGRVHFGQMHNGTAGASFTLESCYIYDEKLSQSVIERYLG